MLFSFLEELRRRSETPEPIFWRQVARDTGIDPATLRGIREQASAIKLRTLDTLSRYVEERLRRLPSPSSSSAATSSPRAGE